MFDIQQELAKLPDKPGVYIMKDKNGSVIYVGKAKVLKNRVRQYFQESAAHSPKVEAMVARIAEFEYIVTDTEFEALILESNLIKDKKPRYNIMLRDDKTYPYIKVTVNEEYPRIYMTRRLEEDGARYFGPYPNVHSIRETINLIRKIFPIRTCKRVLPRDIGRERPCLYYHINQCLGPCAGLVSKEEYHVVVRDVCSFLDGKQEAIIEKLEKQMQEAAERLDFEQAAALRNKLLSVRNIAQEQKVFTVSGSDQDVVGFAASKTDTCIQVFFVRGGKLLGRRFFIIEGSGTAELAETASSFLKQFYGTADMIPPEIIIGADVEDRELIEDWLSSRRGGRVHIRVPKRGEKARMVEMVAKNAQIELDRFNEEMRKADGVQEGLKELAKMLRLDAVPERIEAYDISNTGSSEIAASMVVFENGMPAKKEYRRFRIRSTDTQNDYASMQEVLYRRLKHAMKEMIGTGENVPGAGGSDPEEGKPVTLTGEPGAETMGSCPDKKERGKFSKLPDLIMVDGGIGHVNAVLQVMKDLDVDIPVCGMVKDDRHRTRGLVVPGKELDLAGNLVALRLVTAIQDEAHRFALDYNRMLRAKRYTGSILDEVEGIGPKRKKALLKHFGSVARMRQAGVDDFQAVEGISRSMAEKLYEFFRSAR
ncbi:MAG TPA: excinuclease ABC subunit UvrC [Clostridiales bacterium]|nr:excinuclease ABC subunit UvrC [Clostridiales bacterium]